jgi:hypothetical protein
MADSLEQRISSILPEPEPAPQIINEPMPSMPAPEEASMEGMEIAGLSDVFMRPAKVIAKAFDSKSSIVTDSAVTESVEKIATKAATEKVQGAKQIIQVDSQIQKAADQGLPYIDAKVRIEKSTNTKLTKKQKTKLKEVTKGNESVAPPDPIQTTLATSEEMQSAIAASQKIGDPLEEFPGVIINRVSEDDATKFVSGYGNEVDKVDFNFNYLQSEQDIDKAINATSNLFAKEIDTAKRGVLKDQAVIDMASKLDIAPDLLMAKIGTTFNAEQLVAARHLLVKSANRLDSLAVKIKNMPAGTEDDKLLLELRDHLATHSAIQMRLKAAQTESARALRSFRLPVDGTVGINDPKQIANLLGEMGGRANLKELASAYLELDAQQKARFVDLAGTTTQQLGKVWKELYQMGLMSSVSSAERNFYANLVGSFARAIDTTFASTAGKAFDKTIITPIFGSNSADEVFFSEAIIEYATWIHTMPKAWSAGAKAFVTDAPVYKLGRDVDKVPDPAITAKLFADPESPMAQSVDFLGKAIRLPGRANLFGDEFIKALVANMEGRRLAARDALMAMKNGVDETKALDNMAYQIANPTARTLDKIDTAVLEGSLQSDLGGFGNFLMQSRNRLDNAGVGPIGTFIAPYIKTVINAQKAMLARTPLGQVAIKEIREDYLAGGARRQMALGKAAQGAAFMGLGFYLAMDGTCTGAGPTDPERRKFLRETTGWQPFSCKVGDAYYSYAGLEPIGGMLGIAATLAETGVVYGKEDDDEWHDLLLYASLLPFKYIGELPFLSGMSKFATMIEEAKRDPKSEASHAATRAFFGNAAQSMVGGVVPVPMPYSGLLKQIEDTLDPLKREVTVDPSLPTEYKYFDFMNRSWLAKTPILSKRENKDDDSMLAVSRNLWGQEIKTGDNNAIKWILPFNRVEEDLDFDERRILEIAKARGKMPVVKPDRKVANIAMNDLEYSNMLLYMNRIEVDGRTYRDAIRNALVSPGFVDQMQNGAYEGISQELGRITSEFKEETIMSPIFEIKHPDFVTQVRKNKELAKRKYQQTPRVPLESMD